MRKVILNLAVSLDGYIEGPEGEYDWCFTDQDYGLSDFAAQTDAIFVGRKSYELFAGKEDEYFPGIKKIYVFSDTIKSATHPNVELIGSTDIDTKVQSVINGEGGNIWLYGGAEAVKYFLDKRWISEMQLSVHPVILGSGKPLFENLKNRVELLLKDSITYSSGLVQLIYVLKPLFDTNALDVQLDELDERMF
ncbi:dihydrofolate reductase family protein [Mucilaginibacter aquatilis]|uniref:Dihydrofolate reductase n=1 Tax=Mucilaginibacter aquatilis TaxID=1517760 RepID=A0A6I4IG41_9SPHI|nr:dihydrofolate reductase family protein [Mucilaginibacter aquatilis]MVN92506.1 dihydrofolate reductase [Mucilaginibacter aquatilis]